MKKFYLLCLSFLAIQSFFAQENLEMKGLMAKRNEVLSLPKWV